jgi:hypothetical protein
MVEKFPAKKKLLGFKIVDIEFLLGIPVYVHFARMNRREGV